MNLSAQFRRGFQRTVIATGIVAVAGFVGVQWLHGSLSNLGGTLWKSAAQIQLAADSVGTQLIEAGNIALDRDPDRAQARLRTAGEAATAAYQQVLASGAFNAEQLSALQADWSAYQESLDKWLVAYQTYRAARNAFTKFTAEFVAFGEAVEEIGDGSVEELESNPEKPFTWAGGLKSKWDAADGGMEASIGHLTQLYHFERLARGAAADECKKELAEAVAFHQDAMTGMLETGLFDRPVQEGAAETFAARYRTYFARHGEMMNAAVESLIDCRGREETFVSASNKLVDQLHQLTTLNEQQVVAMTQQSILAGQILRGVIFGVGLVVIVVSLRYGRRLSTSITQSIGEVTTRLAGNTQALHQTSSEITEASAKLAAAASEQAQSLQGTTASLEQIAESASQNATQATQANDLAHRAQSSAQGGQETMARLNQAMASIHDSSSKIRQIIQAIEEVAAQTNLLSLNATIEAARAGEHGRGFAVVAQEVRNLAQRSAQAAQDTARLIAQAVDNAKKGRDVAGEANDSLNAIVGDVAQIVDLLQGISGASHHQSQGVAMVNQAVSAIDEVTRNNAAAAEQCAAAARETRNQADTVRGAVERLQQIVGTG